eukprot:647462-Prymnesium_polylepis.1
MNFRIRSKGTLPAEVKPATWPASARNLWVVVTTHKQLPAPLSRTQGLPQSPVGSGDARDSFH